MISENFIKFNLDLRQGPNFAFSLLYRKPYYVYWQNNKNLDDGLLRSDNCLKRIYIVYIFSPDPYLQNVL